MTRSIIVTFVLVCTRLLAASAQSDQPLWALKTNRYLISQLLTPAGVLIVSTDSALFGVDTATGQVLWTRADIPNLVPWATMPTPTSSFGTADEPPVTPRAWLSPVWGTPYVIVARDSADSRAWIEVIDARSGTRRWSSDSLPIADARGHFQMRDSTLLLYGRSGSGTASKMVFMAVDAGTGTTRWRSETWFSEAPVEYDADGLEAGRGTLDGSQEPLFDTDTTAILIWSQQGPVKVDTRTGERLWTARRLGEPPALAHGYPPPLIADGVAYIPFERRLEALGALDGRPRWPEPRKFGGRIVQMEMTPRGLLVRGGPDWDSRQRQRGFALRGPEPGGKRFLDLLDPATGESRWPKRDKAIEVTTPFVRTSEAVYVATRKQLYRVTLEDGHERELASVNFQAGERPEGLELRSGMLVVLAAHTLMAFDTAGPRRYEAYFPPPGPSTLARLAVLAANLSSVAALVANRGGYMAVYSLQRRDPLRPSAQDYAYVVTAHADSAGIGPPGLLKVHKDTGKPVRRLALGDKWPVYETDAAGTLLFVQADDHEIDCYRF